MSLREELWNDGFEPEMLDQAVRDAGLQLAAQANELGMNEQIEFLRDVAGMNEQEIRDAVALTMDRPGKTADNVLTIGVNRETLDNIQNDLDVYSHPQNDTDFFLDGVVLAPEDPPAILLGNLLGTKPEYLAGHYIHFYLDN